MTHRHRDTADVSDRQQTLSGHGYAHLITLHHTRPAIHICTYRKPYDKTIAFLVAAFAVVGDVVDIEMSMSDISRITGGMRNREGNGELAIDRSQSLASRKVSVPDYHILQNLCPGPARRVFGGQD
jgi:hypothetical protein